MAAPLAKFLVRTSTKITNFSSYNGYSFIRKSFDNNKLTRLTSCMQNLSLTQPRSLHHFSRHVQLPSVTNSTTQTPLVKQSAPTCRPRVSLLVPARNQHRGKSVVTCSRKKGAFMTNKEVPKRFYRLRSGLWIRTICGKGKRHWRKSPQRVWEIKQHVFCNEQQNVLLDKMVSRYYKKPRHWVNNIYEPYEERTGVSEGFKVPKRPFYP